MSKDPQFRPTAPADDSGSGPLEMQAGAADNRPAGAESDSSAASQSGWHELLEETQHATADPKMVELLRNFVRSIPEQKMLTLDTTTQMVTLILRWKFSQRKVPPECAAWIAEVLYYDPTSHQRVEKLWNLARG